MLLTFWNCVDQKETCWSTQSRGQSQLFPWSPSHSFLVAQNTLIKICGVLALMAFKELLLSIFLGLPILCCTTCKFVVFQCIYRSIFISICRYFQRDYIKIQLAAVYFLLSAGWFRQAAFPVEPNNQSKS